MRSASLLSIVLVASSLAAQASWSQLYPAVSPLPVTLASMACFEPLGQVVLVFGIASSPAVQGWKLQGSTWSPFPMPAQTGYARGMVYDSVRQRLVVFGGEPVNNDVWEWNGSNWLQATPVVRPQARSVFAMAFDRARGVTVVFGGNSGGQTLQDVWEWNGSAWSQRAATTPMGQREYTSAAFDPVRRNVVLYGGVRPYAGTTLVFNDTWAWDGIAMTQYTPAVPPPYLGQATMVTDLDRQRVILYGGVPADGITREWNGAEWVERAGPSPGPRVGHAMAYDPSLRRTVLFGGTSSGSYVQDTWIYRTPLPAEVVPFGSGCAGTAGTAVLQAAEYSLPWLGDTMRTVVTAVPPGQPGAVFVSSFGSTQPVPLAALGMPGCDLLVPIDVPEFRPAVAGAAEWSVAIPNVLALAAAVFRQQAFVFDVGVNALGLTNSNAITATLGVR